MTVTFASQPVDWGLVEDWIVSYEGGVMRRRRSRADRATEWRDDTARWMRAEKEHEVARIILHFKPKLSLQQVLGLFVPQFMMKQLEELYTYFDVSKSTNSRFVYDGDVYNFLIHRHLMPLTLNFIPDADPEVLATFKQWMADLKHWIIAGHELGYLITTLVKGHGYTNTLKILPELAVFGKPEWLEREPRPIPKFKMPAHTKAFRRLCQNARLNIATMSIMSGTHHDWEYDWELGCEVKWQFNEDEHYEIPEIDSGTDAS